MTEGPTKIQVCNGCKWLEIPLMCTHTVVCVHPVRVCFNVMNTEEEKGVCVTPNWCPVLRRQASLKGWETRRKKRPVVFADLERIE